MLRQNACLEPTSAVSPPQVASLRERHRLLRSRTPPVSFSLRLASTQRSLLADVFDDATRCHDTRHKGIQWLSLKCLPARRIANDTARQVYFYLLSVCTG